MVCAIITQAIGIHAVFGAFIAGVMLGRSARLRRSDRSELQALTIGVFAPVFFAYSGLKVDLFALHGVGLLALVLGIAIAGKMIGCTAGAMLFGLKPRESLAVAIGMNARGGMEIIVALIGLSLGVLTQEMYAIIVMVAIVTSLMTPPLLELDARRRRAKARRSGAPGARKTARAAALQPRGRQTPGAQRRRSACATGGASGCHARQSSRRQHHRLSCHHDRRVGAEWPRPTPTSSASRTIAEMSGAHNILQRSGSGRFDRAGDRQGERTRLRRDLCRRLAHRGRLRAGRRGPARTGRSCAGADHHRAQRRRARCRCGKSSRPPPARHFRGSARRSRCSTRTPPTPR